MIQRSSDGKTLLEIVVNAGNDALTVLLFQMGANCFVYDANNDDCLDAANGRLREAILTETKFDHAVNARAHRARR